MSAGNCSSGSNANSINLVDFWSQFNEDPLDENRHDEAKYLFLFAPPTGRVCAKAASSRHSPRRVKSLRRIPATSCRFRKAYYPCSSGTPLKGQFPPQRLGNMWADPFIIPVLYFNMCTLVQKTRSEP